MVVLTGIMKGAFLWASGRLGESFDWLDRSWQEADAINDIRSAWVTSIAAWDLGNMGDQKEAMRWLAREISRPRNAESAYAESFLYPAQVVAFGSMGELVKVRRVMSEFSNSQEVSGLGQYMLTIWDGKLEEAAASSAAYLEILRYLRRVEHICNSGVGTAQLYRLPAITPRPRSSCGRASRIQPRAATSHWSSWDVSAWPTFSRTSGIRTRPEVSLDDAAIMAAGEDWRGLAGLVEWSEAAIAVAEKGWKMPTATSRQQ